MNNMSHRGDYVRSSNNNHNHHQRDDRRRSRDRDRGGRESRHSRDDSRGRPRNNDYRDDRRGRGRSPHSYDAEYESRRFRDRRDRGEQRRDERYSRRSRSRESEVGGGGGRNKYNNEDNNRRGGSGRREPHNYSDDSSSREHEKRPWTGAKPQPHENQLRASELGSQSQQHSQMGKTESEYLSKMSDEKLQESFDRYEADPNCDITDGLLDNIVIDKEKIQAEMQERLRQHLLSEGKVYPPPKPEPPQQTTAFANDGSFMDMFKRMQQGQQGGSNAVAGPSSTSTTAQLATANSEQRVAEPKPRPVGPMFGKRRGGKILKTGIVEKKKPIEDLSADAAPGDAWSQYMKEVKRYKAVSCDVDNKNRPLVK